MRFYCLTMLRSEYMKLACKRNLHERFMTINLRLATGVSRSSVPFVCVTQPFTDPNLGSLSKRQTIPHEEKFQQMRGKNPTVQAIKDTEGLLNKTRGMSSFI